MDHRFHLESSQVDYAWNRFVGSPSSILSVIRYHVTSLQRSGSFSCAKEVNQQKTISQSQAMCRNQLHQPQGLKPRPPKKTPIPGLKIWILEKLYFWNLQNSTRIFHTTHAKKGLGMPNHPSQDASLSGKLMFTRTPRNVMSSWWWRLHPATGFTSQCYNPPQRVLSALPNTTLASTWTTAAWSSAASCRKGLVRWWLCWWLPVWKKKNIRMAGWFRKPLEILKKSFVEELETTREARNQQAKQMTWCNSPHSTYHPNPCQPLKTVPPLPSSASLPHSHAEPKEWRGVVTTMS